MLAAPDHPTPKGPNAQGTQRPTPKHHPTPNAQKKRSPGGHQLLVTDADAPKEAVVQVRGPPELRAPP